MRLNMIAEEIEVLLDYSADSDATEWFVIPDWSLFVGVFIPNLTNNANVGIEISRDAGSTAFPVLDTADGQDLIICASTYDPCYVDISDYIRAFIGDLAAAGGAGATRTRFRFTVSVAEDTADMTFYVIARG